MQPQNYRPYPVLLQWGRVCCTEGNISNAGVIWTEYLCTQRVSSRVNDVVMRHCAPAVDVALPFAPCRGLKVRNFQAPMQADAILPSPELWSASSGRYWPLSPRLALSPNSAQPSCNAGLYAGRREMKAITICRDRYSVRGCKCINVQWAGDQKMNPGGVMLLCIYRRTCACVVGELGCIL